MNKIDLIQTLEDDLGLPQDVISLTNVERIWRDVYAATGRVALVSLFDNEKMVSVKDDLTDNLAPKEPQPLSIVRFKKRVFQVLRGYFDIFNNELAPRFKSQSDADVEEIVEKCVEEIYEIFRRTGFFYHSPNNVLPAPLATATTTLGGASYRLYCGFDFGQVSYVDVSDANRPSTSGLGLYKELRSYNARQYERSLSVSSLFDLQASTLSEYWQDLQSGDWREDSFPDDVEYLCWELKRGRRFYWQNQPRRDGGISLARFGNGCDRKDNYCLYRFKNGRCETLSLDERVADCRASENDANRNNEYIRIAVASFAADGKLPEIRWYYTSNANSFVNVELGSQLPPTEEDFFRLYSWPSFDRLIEYEASPFHRTTTKDAFCFFKHELEKIGYVFTQTK